MWFQRLDINDLRNLVSVRLDLGSGLNYFYGDNGAGKTAVLEAVHLLARGRSFRSPQISDLIRQGAARVRVQASILDEHRGEQVLGLVKHRGDRTQLRINGQPARRLSQAAELLPLQVMVPSLSDLVFGAPVERRQWLDWGAFHVKPEYLRTLRGYLHTLRQRNAGLRAVSAGQLPEAALEVWTDELLQLAEAVTAEREDYLAQLLPVLTEVLVELAPSMTFTLRYRRGWPADHSLRKILGDSMPREVKSGITQSGPHRADIDLRVAGMPAAASLSRGQGKTLASALMLSQARLLLATAHRSSVFLIDDIGAELDLPHSERLFRELSALGTQVLATSSGGAQSLPARMAENVTMFHVERGEVRRTGAP